MIFFTIVLSPILFFIASLFYAKKTIHIQKITDHLGNSNYFVARKWLFFFDDYYSNTGSEIWWSTKFERNTFCRMSLATAQRNYAALTAREIKERIE